MSDLDVVQNYFDAWNSRNPEAVAAALGASGTYEDPTTGGRLMGPAMAEYASRLLTAFPDLSFEVKSISLTGDGAVATQWMMQGTNSGPFGGGPPTGNTVKLPGADFFVVDDDHISSVKVYFDQRTLVEQMGLQVIVQPYSIGPFDFGSSLGYATGKQTKPGAFSLTWIDVRSDEEVNEIKERSQQIAQEMMAMPGFISSALMAIGHRMITTTAWEDPESPKQMLRGGAHKEAVDRIFSADLAAAFSTTVWVPERFNGLWVRCTSCNQLSDYERNAGTCRCGEQLPEQPPYR